MNIRVEDNNLIPYNDWLTGNTTIYNGTYTATNFGTVSQIVEYDEDPFGNTGVVWTHNTISPLSRNGFNTAIVDVDINYNYRYSCWVKSTGETRAYFRLYGRVNETISGLTNITTGAFNANSDCFAQIPYNYSDDEWYLWVGHVRSYNTTGTTNLNESGLYSTNGTKLVNFTDWKFLSNINGTSYRLYIPYNTSGTTVKFIYPRIDKCDGTEPSINTLLTNEGMWRSVDNSYIKVEDQNLLDYSDWSTDLSGSTSEFTDVTGYNAKLNQYRQLDTDPFGNTNYIWVASGVTTTGATYGGGYLSSGVTIDNTKIYRISQWCYRFNTGDTNNAYFFGFYTYDINGTLTGATRSDGEYSTNYYTYSRSNNNMSDVNGWFMTTGYLMPYTWTGNTVEYQGKIYYNNGSTHTNNAYNYRFNVNAKYLAIRSYSPYNTTSFAGTKFCYPRIDLIDGTEPSINTLLTNEGMWRSGTTYIKVEDNNLSYYNLSSFNNIGGGSLITTIGPYNYNANIKTVTATATSANGGYYNSGSQANTINPNMDYRFTCWVMVTGGTLSTGSVNIRPRTYADVNASYGATPFKDVTNTGSTSADLNAINVSYSNLSTYCPIGEWRLFSFILRNSGYTGNIDSSDTGIWKPDGTNIGIANGVGDLIMHSGVTLAGITVHNIQNATGTATIYSCYPRIDLIDGTEPSINTLLQNEGMWRKC